MSKGIRLSEKHGVNPSIAVCFFCGEDNGEIILPGRLPGDAEAPRRGVWNHNPCDTCKGHMAQGIYLIQVREEVPTGEPHRTGPICVVKEDYLRRALEPGPALDHILQLRWSFVPRAAWLHLGLPEGDAK
jgi:hypothetical protein